MPSINKVILAGHLTRDPMLKHLPSNTALVEFGIAMNRKWRDGQGQDREDVCFVDCAAFGKTAEVIQQHFQKGKAIFIEGRLKFDQWEDKQGGGKRSKLSVVVENFQFFGGRDGGEQQQSAPSRSVSTDLRNRSRANAPTEPPFAPDGGIKEEDLPF